MKKLLDNSVKKGVPNLDLMFIYNMPIRGISRMTGGIVNMKMANGIVEMANGHAFRGLGHVITGLLFRK